MFDRDLKARWVEELRSGRRKQGFGFLRIVDDGETRECCLGVLCSLVEPDGFQPTSHSGVTGMHAFVYTHGGETPRERAQRFWSNRSTRSVPRALQQKIGLTSTNASHLATMNDRQGASFADIADWIERNL